MTTIVTAATVLLAIAYLGRSESIFYRQDAVVSSSMEAILLGLSNYHDRYGEFPPVGEDSPDGPFRSSWRFRTVPWLDGGPETLGPEFYANPWNSSDPLYQQLRRMPLPVYCFSHRGNPETKVMAITGQGTAFPKGDRSLSIEDLDWKDTILLVTSRSSGVHWMAPGDLPIDAIDAQAMRAMSLDGCSFYVGFADGEVWRLSTDTPAADLRTLATVEGAKRADRDVVLGQYRMDVNAR